VLCGERVFHSAGQQTLWIAIYSGKNLGSGRLQQLTMTAIYFLFFIGIASLAFRRLWVAGMFSGSFFPKTHKERIRFYWILFGVVNFLAFVVHALADGTSAFPSGGRWVDGYYLVASHGKDIAFTPKAYAFSYWHGVLCVVIHFVCMFMAWRLRETEDSKP
jgi:hypothetical protein